MATYTSDDVKKALKDLEKFRQAIVTGTGQAVADICLKVQADIQLGMTNTTVDNGKSYGKRKHHPSIPGAYPAVDYGELRRSITVEVEEHKNRVDGRVGSIITNPPYPVYLEYGTSKMKPRPWLKPSVDKNEQFIKQRFDKALEVSIEDSFK